MMDVLSSTVACTGQFFLHERGVACQWVSTFFSFIWMLRWRRFWFIFDGLGWQSVLQVDLCVNRDLD